MKVMDPWLLGIAVCGLLACLAVGVSMFALSMLRGFRRRFLWYVLEAPVAAVLVHYVSAWPVGLAKPLASRLYYMSPMWLLHLALAPLIFEWIMRPRWYEATRTGRATRWPSPREYWVKVALVTGATVYFLDRMIALSFP